MDKRPLIFAVRTVTVLYSAVFLAAALQNFGARVSVGPFDWYFSVPIWQAGVGEIVIGLALLGAAITQGSRLYWVAYALSGLGILFGLSAARVVESARAIHVLLVPLGILGVALLALARRSGARSSGTSAR